MKFKKVRHEILILGHEILKLGHEILKLGHEIFKVGHEIFNLGHEINMLRHETICFMTEKPTYLMTGGNRVLSYNFASFFYFCNPSRVRKLVISDRIASNSR